MQLARIVLLATGPATDRRASVEANQRTMLYWLERSAKLRPDIVCFSEMSLHLGLTPQEQQSGAQAVPGPSTAKASAYAERFRTHIIWTLIERDHQGLYNTAVLIGRDGQIIGRYRKFQPTSYEMAAGICPGMDVQVWQTDFGRVGIATCFDIKFAEVGLALSRGRANIVFWPSMFAGGLRLNSWARDYGFHMVSSFSEKCTVINSRGQQEDCQQPFSSGNGLLACAFAELNTDCKTYHLDYNQDKLAEIEIKYGDGIDIHFCRDEAMFVMSSQMPDRSVQNIEREFELEDLRNYLDKAAGDRKDHLPGLKNHR